MNWKTNERNYPDQSKRKMLKNIYRRHTLNVYNLCYIIGVFEVELGENWAEAISEELLTEKFPTRMKSIKPLVYL